MKAFKKHVKEMMKHKGWRVSHIKNSLVQLYCTRSDSRIYLRAYGNGHGHIHRKKLGDLKEIAKKFNAPVLVAKATSEKEIRLLRLDTIEKMIGVKGKEK